jgi:transposase
MGNCTTHKGDINRRNFKMDIHKLYFMSPYSSQLNEIEDFFQSVKNNKRKLNFSLDDVIFTIFRSVSASFCFSFSVMLKISTKGS